MVDRAWPLLRALSGLVAVLGMLLLGVVAMNRLDDAATVRTQVSGRTVRNAAPEVTVAPSTTPTSVPWTTVPPTEPPPPADLGRGHLPWRADGQTPWADQCVLRSLGSDAAQPAPLGWRSSIGRAAVL